MQIETAGKKFRFRHLLLIPVLLTFHIGMAQWLQHGIDDFFVGDSFIQPAIVQTTRNAIDLDTKAVVFGQAFQTIIAFFSRCYSRLFFSSACCLER